MTLLDTHVLLWAALEPTRLSATAQQRIAHGRQQGALAVSDISFWEIAMLMEKNRLSVGTDCLTFLDLLVTAYNLHVYAISTRIAAESARLPPQVNKDTADRLIAATAIVEATPLLTADRNLLQTAAIPTMW